MSAAPDRAPQATAGQLGELFQYTLADRVTIAKNQSALVPIVQTEIAADKVSLWSAVNRTQAPLRALWITNSSALVLDGGSFSVVDGEAFGGEGLVGTVHPGERRLISYAADLGLRITTEVQSEATGIVHIKLGQGMLTETLQARRHTAYTAHSGDQETRTVVIEHPKPGAGWSLAAGMHPAEEAATVDRFPFTAGPNQNSVFLVHEVSTTEAQTALDQLTEAEVDTLGREHALTPELETALRKVVAAHTALGQALGRIEEAQHERDRLTLDQERVRQNLAALVKGAPDEKALAARFTKAMTDDEDQLAAINSKLTAAQAELRQVQDAFQALCQGLELDTEVDGAMTAPEP